MDSNKLDPRILANQSINGILETMKYYVDENPYDINFSSEFINAFRGLLEVDSDLMGENFEKILSNFKNEKDELLALKMNFFKLQLHIILKRKVIIERECPDNPNIKDIIKLFNRKIEALLKILHSQYEMEGDENNPLKNSYIELKDKKGNDLKELMNKRAQTLRIANDRISALELTLQQKQEKRQRTIERIDFLTSCQEIIDILKDRHSIAMDDYSTVLLTLKEEIASLDTSIERDESELSDIQRNVQTYENEKDDSIAKLIINLTEEIEVLEKNQKTIGEEYGVIKSQFRFEYVENEYNRLAGEGLDCDKEISEMYVNLCVKFNQAIDNFLDINVNYETKVDLLNFLQTNGTKISETDFDSIEQRNKSKHKIENIQKILVELDLLRQVWEQPFHEISSVLHQYFSSLYTQFEERLKNVSKYVRAPISTGNSKIHSNESSYLCDLDVLKSKIATIDSQLDIKTKLLTENDEWYDAIQHKMIILYKRIANEGDRVRDFARELSPLKKRETDIFETRINLKNQILTLQQERQMMETKEQFIHINEQATETGFGLSVTTSEIYDLYKHVYNLFHSPIVMKCYVLLIHGLVNDEIRTKITDRIEIFYEQIDNSLNEEISSIYDGSVDTKFVKTYDSKIDLTNGKPSVIVQDLGTTIKDESETVTGMNHQRYVHVGMCLFKLLKHYISKPETAKPENIELFKNWMVHKNELIKHIDKESINSLYDQYLKEGKNNCEFVLYETCNTLYRDPMYRFQTKTSDYSTNYTNLQIDYYNTCLRLGFNGSSLKYNREHAVSYLNSNYENIAEHYILDNKLSRIYLHYHDRSNVLDTDSYFNSNMIHLLIDPSTAISMVWKIYIIRTKVKSTNIEGIVQTLVKHVESNEKHDKTVLKNYDENEELKTVKNLSSFSVIFHWKNNKNTSTVYVCQISDEHIIDTEISTNLETQTEPENIFEIVKQHAFENYTVIKQLMDPCWSKSSLVHFDLAKQNNNSNFGVRCDLSVRKYDYNRIWIILDTTDSDEPSYPNPYIDTSFLKILNDMSIILELLKDGNKDYMDMYIKKHEFLREISSQQVLNKMQRLVNECIESEHVNNVYKESQVLFTHNNIDELVKLIEQKLNKQSCLGKLFYVLGTMDNIIQFNETEKSTVMSRFEKSLLRMFRFFLGK